MSIESQELSEKKAAKLGVLLIIGVILSGMVIGFLVWILKEDALSGEGMMGGTAIIIVWFVSHIFLLFATILTFMRTGYKTIQTFLMINIVTGLLSVGIGTIFSAIGLFKLSKTRIAFPSEVERLQKKELAKKKNEKLEIECPDCGKAFEVEDDGGRPLAIKCPSCGVEGEL